MLEWKDRLLPANAGTSLTCLLAFLLAFSLAYSLACSLACSLASSDESRTLPYPPTYLSSGCSVLLPLP
ncbi:hypothetical protein VTK73DRAFT_2882 [Phialemonium thermophilum]|uniref:Secreted peptide n=1 Tax=Phialemonium thermophilum TaxID=223376 RepID=A0ABR3VN75_9PEZI